ncbi:hypothetical protein [Thermomonospora amylolytica]|uniref:hypothetical protein n=1 Tax=Thermomonospora amylolytica TaxID=1411117 RepID=UPI000E6C75F8|nr:hypothetical protein [Thermomonospora amylolytica]
MAGFKKNLLVLTLVAAVAVSPVAVSPAMAAPEAPEAPQGKARTASVTGSGEFRLTFWSDEDVRSFTFDARATPYTRPVPGAPQGLPTDAVGTVKVSHYLAAQGVTVRFEAEVDCLTTSPGYAALTAKVVRADDLVKGWMGKRLGFSVQDAAGHRDRVGLSWVVSNLTQNADGQWAEATVGTCMAPAPFAPVTKGGYTVRHVDLPPAPQS